MPAIKIIIVDDHKIIRDGLIAILKDDQSIDVIGDVSSGDELSNLLGKYAADVILLDMHMPLKNGVEVTRELKRFHPDVKILINTMSEIPEEIEMAVKAGVNGYLLKSSGAEELIKAIKTVAGGSTYYGAAVVTSFIKSVTKPSTSTNKGLSPTEIKILGLLYAEKSHQEIMDEMKTTKATLTTHIQNMYRKLNVRTEMGLVKYALKEKLIGG